MIQYLNLAEKCNVKNLFIIFSQIFTFYYIYNIFYWKDIEYVKVFDHTFVAH